MNKFKDNRQFFFSEEDDFEILRKSIHSFTTNEICSEISCRYKCDILEIGPSGAYDSSTSFNEFDTSSVIKKCCEDNSCNYYTLDVEESRCDYTCSVTELAKLNKKFDIIVMLSVLEHVDNIFAVPEQLSCCLNSGGTIFISTPFLFKVHGPTPDYWRMTEYAYRYMFGNLFDLEITTYPPKQLGKNSFPLCFNVVGRKK